MQRERENFSNLGFWILLVNIMNYIRYHVWQDDNSKQRIPDYFGGRGRVMRLGLN